jgi:hypothetical protein
VGGGAEHDRDVNAATSRGRTSVSQEESHVRGIVQGGEDVKFAEQEFRERRRANPLESDGDPRALTAGDG